MKFKELIILTSAQMLITGAVYAAKYQEAPELAELVKSGKLPAVEERLPDNPVVVGPGREVALDDLPNWEVGSYGGEFRSISHLSDYDWNLRDAVNEGFLSTPAHKAGPIEANIAEEFDINDDYSVFYFKLRKGLKWSDGVPVSTEDVRFTYEEVIKNKEITPTPHYRFRSGCKPDGKLAELEIIDDLAFRITYEKGCGRLMKHFGASQVWGAQYNDWMQPSHVLKKYHPDHASKAEIQKLLKEKGYNDDEWVRLFKDIHVEWYEIPRKVTAGYPNLGPWIRVESSPELIVMERNPYYFKVDTAGNQLPYVDRYVSVQVADAENIPLKVIGGEVNFHRDLIEHDKVPLLKKNEKSGNYRVYTNLVYHNAPVAMMFNYNNPDKNWQKVVYQKEFRLAVNMAINNQAIIDTQFLGMGKRSEWFPLEFNPTKAESILDSIGMDKKDSEGFRIGPDGKTFEIIFEIPNTAGDWIRMAELIRSDLQGIGLKTTLKAISDDLFQSRRNSNELYASMSWMDDVNWPYLVFDYMPNTRINWGLKWHEWYTSGGQSGDEPPLWIKNLYQIDEEIRKVWPGTERAKDAEAVFTAWMKEYIPLFPVARDVVGPVIIPPNAGNIAESGFSSATFFAAEQIFFK